MSMWEGKGGLRVESEEKVIVEALFPTKEKFKMLQMITEQPVRAMTPLSVLGVFRRRFNSVVLKMYQEELNLNKVAQDRQGRIELAEVSVGRRASLAPEIDKD